MRLRFQVQLRTLLLAVAVVACTLFVERTRRRWVYYRKQATNHATMKNEARAIARLIEKDASNCRARMEELRRLAKLEQDQELRRFYENHAAMFQQETADCIRDARDARRQGDDHERLEREYRRRWW
jgi:hypothetical protein